MTTEENETPPPDDLEALLVAQAADAIIYADVLGVIRVWNAAAAELFGFSSTAALGASLDLIIPEPLRAAHWRGYQAAMASGRTRLHGRPTLTKGVHGTGRPLYVEMSFSVVKDAGGLAIGSVAVARDVTDKRRAG